MAGTAQVTVPVGSYVSLGTGPLYATFTDRVQVVASASQPPANAVGMPLANLSVPFNFTLAEALWAQSLSLNSCTATVTT